jgi:hypothetical protein
MKNRKFLLIFLSIVLSSMMITGTVFARVCQGVINPADPKNWDCNNSGIVPINTVTKPSPAPVQISIPAPVPAPSPTSVKTVSPRPVQATPAKTCTMPNSHIEGSKCQCNEDYKFENGTCVQMTILELCGTEHAHTVGNECECDSGYSRLNGQCTSTSSAISVPAPTNVSTQQGKNPVPIDPINVMVTQKDDPLKTFSVKPLIVASTKNAPKTEIQRVAQQEASIDSYSSSENTEVQLSPNAEQEINLVKTIIKENVEKDLKNWEIKVQSAEMAGNVKDKKDKEKFEQLKDQEDGVRQQIKDNEDALMVMHRQNVALILSTED